jgi:hypothetical protein
MVTGNIKKTTEEIKAVDEAYEDISKGKTNSQNVKYFTDNTLQDWILTKLQAAFT